MEMSPEERLRIVREAQQKSEKPMMGMLEREAQSSIDDQVEKTMTEVNAFLDGLRLFNSDSHPVKKMDEYKFFLADCIKKYLRADHLVSKKIQTLVAFSHLSEKEKTTILQELISDFNSINGFLDSPRSAVSARKQSPQIFYDIMDDPNISDEYKTPGLMRTIASNYSTDPKGALERIESTVQQLLTDPEIPEEYKKHWIIRSIAIKNTHDPKGAIMKIEKKIKKMMSDKSVSDQFKTPALLRSIAVFNSNPNEALRNAEKNFDDMSSDPKIPKSWKQPWLLKYVAVNHGKNPKKAIKNMIAKARELREDPSIPAEYKVLWILQRITSHTPVDPKSVIDHSLLLCKELEQDEEIPINIRNNKILLFTASFSAPQSAKEFLLNSTKREALEQSIMAASEDISEE